MISKILSYPRFKLVSLPTPMEKSRRLGERLGIDLWFKRDDVMELALGGNKARKLEFIFGHILHQGYDAVITSGAIHSNHARLTIAAAKKAGLEAHVVLYKHLPGIRVRRQGNILLNELLGGIVYYVEDQESAITRVENLRKELEKSGKKPYVIPTGGANEYGVMSYVMAALEIYKQSLDLGFKVDYVVHPTGTATTQAGLVLGFKLLGVRDVKVLGISAGRRSSAIIEQGLELAEITANILGSGVSVSIDDFIVIDKYTYGGYGVITREVVDVMKAVGQLEGMILDPIYTAKAMSGLIDLASKKEIKGTVVFIHTGGVPALFQYGDEVSEFI